MGAKVGAIVGATAGSGFGTGLAIEEFNTKEHSTTAKVAHAVGKVAIVTAVASSVLGVPNAISMAEDAALLGVSATTLTGPAVKLGAFAAGYTASQATQSKK